MNCVRIDVLESEVFSHVDLFPDEFICLGELNSIEEVGKVFVNLDVFLRHSEAPLLKVGRKDFLDDKQDSCTNGHEEEWECRTDVSSMCNTVLRKHGMSLLINIAPFVFEDLLIAQHPVAVKQQENGGIFHHFNAVDGELVVKRWWKSNDVGNTNSFAYPLVEQVKCCEREK